MSATAAEHRATLASATAAIHWAALDGLVDVEDVVANVEVVVAEDFKAVRVERSVAVFSFVFKTVIWVGG